EKLEATAVFLEYQKVESLYERNETFSNYLLRYILPIVTYNRHYFNPGEYTYFPRPDTPNYSVKFKLEANPNDERFSSSSNENENPAYFLPSNIFREIAIAVRILEKWGLVS